MLGQTPALSRRKVTDTEYWSYDMTSTFLGSEAKMATPESSAGLSEEARKALNAAIDALTDWRADTAELYAENSRLVFGKLAVAAKATGWPSELIDATRQQMQQTSKMQLEVMDQIMDAWERQVKAHGAPYPTAWSTTPRFLGMGPFAGMPNFSNNMSSLGMMNPFLFWMQAADVWQKSWFEVLRFWTEMQRSAFHQTVSGNGRLRTH
jgi:hypothetical protein